jgi:hypothetical protein
MADASQNKSHSLCLRNYPMSDDTSAANEHSPLKKLAEWEDDVISLRR